jgi:formate-dependent nitrite reductase membrane component NrfD
VEVGLESACVIVFPEQAIVAGDLDDPSSRIARLVAREPVQVRKAEQGTKPKVFYVGADTANLTPQLQAPTRQYLWAQRPAEEVSLVNMLVAQSGDGRGDPALSRPVYDVPHMPRPWGWKVSTYLWTKSVAAGALLVAALGILAGEADGGRLSGVLAPLVALAFLALTTGLLVFDLKRPDRFHYILFKSNVRSWLVWGAWILMAYGAIGVMWLLAGLTGNGGLVRGLAIPTALLAAAAAGYSAFLFGQAEGRDFWQSSVLLPHLVVAAVIGGAAALQVIQVIAGRDTTGIRMLGWFVAGGVLLHAILLVAELFGSHANADVGRAARLMTHGYLARRFWGGAAFAGTLLPLVLVWVGQAGAVAAGLLALGGLWMYEDLWVRAGQSIPLS